MIKLFVVILLVFHSQVFADVIDDQVNALQAQMQKALDVRNLNEENIQNKMQEISESVSAENLGQLNKPINAPPEGMSQEELRKMELFVQQELNKHGVTQKDLEQLKRQISDLIQAQ